MKLDKIKVIYIDLISKAKLKNARNDSFAQYTIDSIAQSKRSRPAVQQSSGKLFIECEVSKEHSNRAMIEDKVPVGNRVEENRYPH